MTSTTTNHIKALLVDDGREFAMIRKTDLAALAWAVEGGIYKDRYLDHVGWQQLKIADLGKALIDARHEAATYRESARNHGTERRRYMANNKALQARVDALEHAAVGMQAHWEEQSRQMFEYIDQLIAGAGREASLESQLLRVARFKRKFPSIGRIMDLTP